MCGIVGIFAYDDRADSVNRQELRLIRDAMLKRGPDGSGEWISGDRRVGLGHRRLSIIDLSSRAAQPMQMEDGSLAISYNGEIYNYRDLREKLVREGCRFRSESDTEVILHLYQKEGAAALHKLWGMFSFAIWDNRKRSMLLARDPYGIKPLYYADDGKTIRVASSVKALVSGGKVSKALSPAGVTGYYLWGSVPEPLTIYHEICELPAGHLMRITQDGIKEKMQYASVAETFKNVEYEQSKVISKNEFSDKLRESLHDSVKRHLVADVPVGVFLSSGIDSGALVGLASQAISGPLRTMTLTFEEYKGSYNDEAPLARKVSEQYKTRHFERLLTRNEFKGDLPRVFSAMDQPSIDGLNTYFISKMASEQGLKVVLSGLGGDELFCGYPSFRQIPIAVAGLAIPSRIPFLADLCGAACAGLSSLYPVVHPKWAGLVKYGGSYPGAYFVKRGLFMPWELQQVMDPEMAREGLRDFAAIAGLNVQGENAAKTAYGNVAILESSLYLRNQLLRDADWAGMAHSVEIRTPYVDWELLRSLAGPITANQKNFRKKMMAQVPTTPLPETVANRAKTGFTVPMGQWLESDNTLDAWRRIPLLAKKKCHWSRRWAHTTLQAYQDTF